MSRTPSAPLGASDAAAPDPTAVYVRAALDAGELEGLYLTLDPDIGWVVDDAAAAVRHSLAKLGRPGRDGLLARALLERIAAGFALALVARQHDPGREGPLAVARLMQIVEALKAEGMDL